MMNSDDGDRILVVDDDPEIRDLVSDYLARDGFIVKSARDGAGLKNFVDSGETFDLIVLDLMLPGEDGLQLCRYLGASHTSEVPILMLSARADDVDRIIGLESGADDYLVNRLFQES